MKFFRVFWLDGKREVMKGASIAMAFAAVDYYEEISEEESKK